LKLAADVMCPCGSNHTLKGITTMTSESEFTLERRGHANGFKPRIVDTRLGDITFAIPQVRKGASIRKRWNKGCAASEP